MQKRNVLQASESQISTAQKKWQTKKANKKEEKG